jgi:hypothetical protein
MQHVPPKCELILQWTTEHHVKKGTTLHVVSPFEHSSDFNLSDDDDDDDDDSDNDNDNDDDNFVCNI